MNIVKNETAQEYYDRWHQRLSQRQATSLENIKQACDEYENMGEGLVKINVTKIGNYCQKKLNISPSAQTIRNMKVTNKGSAINEHVFKTYIEKRALELSFAYPKSKKNVGPVKDFV